MCYQHFCRASLTLEKLPTSLIRLPKQCSGFASFRVAQTKEYECMVSSAERRRLQLL